jgi:hypothetical protein
MSLSDDFHKRMLDVYDRAKIELDYRATRFLRAVREHGGVAYAKRSLSQSHSGTPHQGLQRIIDAGRPDLTMEYVVLTEPYSQLFTDAELAEARSRLARFPEHAALPSIASLTSKEAVLKAMSEYDQLGGAKFLANYGYGPARHYFLQHNGRSYDSKAIAGVAYGYQYPERGPLAASEFSGGAATVAAALEKLGFEITRPDESPEPADPAVYLLTWNPARFAFEELEQVVKSVKAGSPRTVEWSTGGTKRIQPGDRIFFLRQGVEPRGIYGSGWAASEVRPGPHWDPSQDAADYVAVRVDAMVSPEALLPRNRLNEGAMGTVHWDTQRSGTTIVRPAAAGLEHLWAGHLESIRYYDEDLVIEQLGPNGEDLSDEDAFDPMSLHDARKWTQASIVRRQGQPAFRGRLLEIYERRCAITGCDAVPTLEAAHITPYRGTETNHPANGILLRADLHTLFDLGLLAIDVDRECVVLAPELRAGSYAELHGQAVQLPSDPPAGMRRDVLRQHLAGCAGLKTDE